VAEKGKGKKVRVEEEGLEGSNKQQLLFLFEIATWLLPSIFELISRFPPTKSVNFHQIASKRFHYEVS